MLSRNRKKNSCASPPLPSPHLPRDETPPALHHERRHAVAASPPSSSGPRGPELLLRGKHLEQAIQPLLSRAVLADFCCCCAQACFGSRSPQLRTLGRRLTCAALCLLRHRNSTRGRAGFRGRRTLLVPAVLHAAKIRFDGRREVWSRGGGGVLGESTVVLCAVRYRRCSSVLHGGTGSGGQVVGHTGSISTTRGGG